MNDEYGGRGPRGPLGGGSNRLFDEFAKLMTDAAGVAQGARREVETAFRSQAERFMSQMDIVQREEFEALKQMAANARMENEALKERVGALEEQLAGKTKKAAAKRPSAKKT